MLLQKRILFKYLTVASLFLLSACHTMINLPEPMMMNNKHVQISGGLSFPRPYVPISIAGQFKNIGLKIQTSTLALISSAKLSYNLKLKEKTNPNKDKVKQLNLEPVLHAGQYIEKNEPRSSYFTPEIYEPKSRYASLGSSIAMQIHFVNAKIFTVGGSAHVGYADQFYRISKNFVSPGSPYGSHQFENYNVKTMFVGVSPYIRYQWEYFFVEYTAGMVVGGTKLKASPYARIKAGLTF